VADLFLCIDAELNLGDADAELLTCTNSGGGAFGGRTVENSYAKRPFKPYR